MSAQIAEKKLVALREEFASELFILCRALSESKSKTQLELSANDTCALNKNKQSAVRI